MDDEFFGTLGGSLMKDLLADLQVEDGDFSLEHLERELAQLDSDQPQSTQPLPSAPLNVASLVVSHAQEQQGSLLNPVTVAPPNSGMDAWSLSLQNFTALSLQDDFLAADSARKQQQAATSNNRRVPSLDAAEDYDIGERPAIAPPPGLGAMPPNPRAFPKTPQNSLAVPEEDANIIRNDIMSSVADRLKSTQESELETAPMALLNSIPVQQTTPINESVPAPPAEVIPPQGMVANMPGPPQGVIPPQNNVPQPPLPPAGEIPQQPKPPHAGPPPGAFPPQAPTFAGVAAANGAPMPGGAPRGMGAVLPPVLLAVPAGGPAWQAPPAAPVRNAPPVYCNPHPSAPPIPGTALESKFMSARDVTYVIHSILKPVLAAGVSDDDYHIQYMLRMGGPQANPKKPKHATDMNKEMSSRENRSKEWSSEKGTLGYIAKTNVARPRALIATPQQAAEQDSEHKQRASLWKARVYCDQAYQSFQRVVEIWRSASPGAVPPEVQIHLVKLMKCMGITLVDKDYQVDPESVKLLVKLSKGRVLIARVLDLALLPPNAVQSLLPPLSDVLIRSMSKNQDLSNDRLLRSMSNVVQKLKMSSDSLLNCLEVVQNCGKAGLSSTASMEYVHILLRKGAFVLGQDPSPEKRAAWSKAENEFVALLQGL